MSDLIPSLIRTYVPLLVSWLAGLLIARGVEVSTETQLALASALGAIVAAVYYAAVRAAEKRWPALGVLLGSKKTPSYGGSDSEADGEHRA